MRLPRIRTLLLTPLLALCACGSSTLSQAFTVSPSDASLYMNGEQVRKGTNLPLEFDFSNCDRVLIQAVSPGYESSELYLTERDIARLARGNEKLRIDLRQR